MAPSEEFYANPVWDVDAWVEIIAVEYESLIGAYAFDETFRSMGGSIRVLDVGCGTAIFPGYLDRILSDDVMIHADLLDMSPTSLARAGEVLTQLDHFTVGESFLARIEDLPPLGEHRYDVIWAIHSFTTVDVDRMADAIDRLMAALKPGGRLMVYQLTAASAYQRIHAAYRESNGGERYMEYEDTVELLDAAGYEFEVYELAFDHVVPQHALTGYLQKVTLDDSVTADAFEPIVSELRHDGAVRFPQTVNLIVLPKAGPTVTPLTDPYYSKTHEVFRRSTDQTELMLDRLVAHVDGHTRLSICSVGSGAGLFEMPMLDRLGNGQIVVDRFVGVDPSEHACAVLESKLAAAAHPGLDYELVVEPFEFFETDERFDVVLFNHVVEYLGDNALSWIERSEGLISGDGAVLVFSPTRGGINQPYEENMTELTGAPPIFADDIARLLENAGIAYSDEMIIASCDISALDRPDAAPEKLMLLSFLAQRDCRQLSDEDRERYVDFYRSLRRPGERGIAHPTTLFVI